MFALQFTSAWPSRITKSRAIRIKYEDHLYLIQSIIISTTVHRIFDSLIPARMSLGKRMNYTRSKSKSTLEVPKSRVNCLQGHAEDSWSSFWSRDCLNYSSLAQYLLWRLHRYSEVIATTGEDPSLEHLPQGNKGSLNDERSPPQARSNISRLNSYHDESYLIATKWSEYST